MMRTPPPRKRQLVLLSLEPWDDTWRRNQHLAAALVRSRAVADLWFVAPAMSSPPADWQPLPGITVHTPQRRLPTRLGGSRVVGRSLRRGVLRDADVLWINDPVVGVHSLTGAPALYDVTDDWRAARAPKRAVRRLIKAEDRLALRATTVVCSDVLRQRWRDRYGIEAHLVRNGVDLAAHRSAASRALPGPAPHVGYIGTLHDERLDVDLLVSLASTPDIGTVHLVGPDSFSPRTRSRLAALPNLILHGPAPAEEVPHWMASLDVLVSPHLVTPFTLSLDAIKAYEYLASGRPVVATPTSGFQLLDGRVGLADRAHFVDAVREALVTPAPDTGPPPATWDDRAREMAKILEGLFK
jgi:teichuronic acid biosynthesis glycosyltransferase TuaH